MAYGILRFLWGLWFLVGLASVVYAFATAVWGGEALRVRLKRAGRIVIYGFVWPLAAFTQKGRRRVVEAFTGGETWNG